MTDEVERTTIRTAFLRLMPLLLLCYFLAYIDRINIGFAALTMNRDLGLSAYVYGVGAGCLMTSGVQRRLSRPPWRMARERAVRRVGAAETGGVVRISASSSGSPRSGLSLPRSADRGPAAPRRH